MPRKRILRTRHEPPHERLHRGVRMTKRRIVMLVDDCDVDRYIVQRLLRSVNSAIEILEMCGVAEATEWLQANPIPDDTRLLILLDLNMPGMNGFDFLDAMRQLRGSRKDLARCDVKILSSSRHPDDVQRTQSYPFVSNHMTKMPDAAQLRNALCNTGEFRNLAFLDGN
jgi:CheY-like chemotaxis protein